MRGKRAKAYRKLMHKYELFFKFRQPYQVLVDAEFLEEADKCKMDLLAYLTRTVQGEVKPMITQCSMRHLYASSSKTNPKLVELAKTLERRRCNHHVLDQPLSTYDCLTSVIHPGESLRNKHRYVVATQDSKLRVHLRSIPGVPIVYLNRSVMILEAISHASSVEGMKQEHAKFTEGILEKTPLGKRKRDGDDTAGGEAEQRAVVEEEEFTGFGDSGPDRKKKRGPKQPNPLSMRKKKTPATKTTAATTTAAARKTDGKDSVKADQPDKTTGDEGADGGDSEKKKRRRRKRKPGETAAQPGGAAEEGEADD